jgi:hypothetical protein
LQELVDRSGGFEIGKVGGNLVFAGFDRAGLRALRRMVAVIPATPKTNRAVKASRPVYMWDLFDPTCHVTVPFERHGNDLVIVPRDDVVVPRRRMRPVHRAEPPGGSANPTWV